ncbi:PhoX family protein [Flavobacterium sp. CHNK8]|uniref:PhoX family protein n=1 Tax=Flavobacterium sp. CHNK8 TaxID=2871165 RepID=UPI001C8EB53B|nr:PhoX family protein [Flavobacterium sp. CHNK8]QZK91488.1 PhoX family protein [Flavobacterium sp. CHNK8]
MNQHYLKKIALSSVLLAAVVGCQDDKNETPSVNTAINFSNVSTVPALAVAKEGFENLQITSLLSSSDVLAQSPAFVYGAQPDGAGLMKDPSSDGYIMITNHEILKSVSRVYLDKTLKPVKGDYIVDAVGGLTRLCSATLASPAIHGFGPLFLTAGESGEESMVHGIDPLGLTSMKNRTDRVLPALGKASMENAVPLPKDAYPGKTVIVIGEDQSYSTSHASAGQVIMYMSSTVGDLSNGKLYALKRNDGNQVETSMNVGTSFDVSFVEIPNAKNLTGAVINTTVNELGAIRFSRVEDVDYRKGSAKNNRELYFTATGQASSNAPVAGYTMWGRVYKLVLNDANPLIGKLELVIEGDSTPGTGIINPDNLCVTENFVYTQEDGDSFYTAAKHDSYIWQYNIASKVNKPWLTMNHKRTDAAWNTAYNQANEMRFGSWEYGAMEDISDIIGVPNTFIVNIHPHTWQKDAFLNADGSGLNTNKEGGQTLIIRNVQR